MIILIGNKAAIDCTVAKTPDQLERGLLGCDKLEDQTGMLFDFGKSQKIEMTMTNMVFPIDMIFINKNSKIIKIAHHVEPEEEIECNDSIAVIETNADLCKKYKIKVGDKITRLD